MPASKRKTSRRELFLGLILTLLGSPIVGSAILLATVSIILSIIVLTLTGEEVFFGAIAFFGAMLVVLYLLLWRIVRRARVLVERWRAVHREEQRVAHLGSTLEAAEYRLSDEAERSETAFSEVLPGQAAQSGR